MACLAAPAPAGAGPAPANGAAGLAPSLFQKDAAPPEGSAEWGGAVPAPFTWRQLRAAGGQLGERDLLLQTGGMGAASALVSLRDDAWTAWMVEQRPLGGGAYDVGYQIGHRRTQAALVVAFTAVGWASGHAEVRDTGLLLAQAQLVGAGLCQLIKGAADRPRPDGGDHASFPSGHAVSAWTMAEVLQRRHGWWIGGPAYAAALYTGASRVQGNRHHPSDVLAGFALAHWISAAVCRSTRPAREPRVGLRWLAPGVRPDGTVALLHAEF